MSQKTHKSAVVIIPPSDVWPPIQAIREKHDSHYPRWMPHITLLYPFYPKSAFPDLLPRLEMACLRVKPFEITLGRFHYFWHRGKRFTLWLKPEPAEPILHLHEALYEHFPACDEIRKHASGFTPHCTIAQAESRRQKEEWLRGWRESWNPLAFSVNAISLISREGAADDMFKVENTIQLG